MFGEPVVPGAPVLRGSARSSRVPGFLPHLSGRENLRLYWAATGRPDDEADFETALEIAGLGASIDRRVQGLQPRHEAAARHRPGDARAARAARARRADQRSRPAADRRDARGDAALRRRPGARSWCPATCSPRSSRPARTSSSCTSGKLVAAGSVADIAGAGGLQLAVADPARGHAGARRRRHHRASSVPARRALEDVFLGLIGDGPVSEPQDRCAPAVVSDRELSGDRRRRGAASTTGWRSSIPSASRPTTRASTLQAARRVRPAGQAAPHPGRVRCC